MSARTTRLRRHPGRVALRVLAAVVLVAIPAGAAFPHAPTDQYATFDYRSQTIRDLKTKLTWTRATASRNFAGAGAYCATFGANVRLPTVNELLSLVDEEPHQEYEGLGAVTKHIDPDAFPNTPTDLPYWTSTADLLQGGGRRMTVNFGTGGTSGELAGSVLNVRCVVYQP